jgi:hypothetical protein
LTVLKGTTYKKTGVRDLPCHYQSIATTRSNYMAAAGSANAQATTMMRSAWSGNIGGVEASKEKMGR